MSVNNQSVPLNIQPLLQELQLKIDEASVKKKPSPEDSIFLIIAEMIAKHEQSEKATQLSPKELEAKYIEEAIAEAVGNSEQSAMKNGDLNGDFQSIKDMLNALLDTVKGMDPGLKSYIENTANSVNNFQNDPKIKADIEKAKAAEAQYDSDYAELQKYKDLYKKYFWTPGYAAYLLGKMAYYTAKLLKEAGSLNKSKVDAGFQAEIQNDEKILVGKERAFLTELGNSAQIVVSKNQQDIQLDLSSKQDEIQNIKADSGLAKSLGDAATGSNI